jgi:hypothetical protein
VPSTGGASAIYLTTENLGTATGLRTQRRTDSGPNKARRWHLVDFSKESVQDWLGGKDGTKLMMSRHEPAEDRSAIALRLFVALCAQYPDKYIALIQPRDNTNGAQIPRSLAAELEVKRARNP